MSTVATRQPEAPHQGRAHAAAWEIISRHATSEGLVIYRRCHCGAVEARLLPHHPEHTGMVAGSPHAAHRQQ